jgi:5'-phosphate synthase pdxT subunit
MRIGVLALQGAFVEHQNLLKKLNVDAFTIRNKKELAQPMDGLILPGGESTTMYKLIKDLHLEDDIKKMITDGLPVMGTCAGLLLLAKTIHNYEKAFLQTMDITAKKNAYGKQLGSFRTLGKFKDKENIPFVFIRAPFIEKTSDEVEVLSIVNNQIVAARQNNQLVTAFHPELTNDTTIHQYFIEMVTKYLTNKDFNKKIG